LTVGTDIAKQTDVAIAAAVYRQICNFMPCPVENTVKYPSALRRNYSGSKCAGGTEVDICCKYEAAVIVIDIDSHG